MESMRVHYRLHVSASDAAERAEAIALEQTVEVPRPVVRDRFIEEQVMGRVASVEPEEGGGQRAIVEFPWRPRPSTPLSS